MSQPVAFWCYAHDDDRDNRLTKLCNYLTSEVRIKTGRDFIIFRDQVSISLGQDWRKRIEESLSEVMFIIPIITPRFFNSSYCRDEVDLFLRREKKLEREDLVLPIDYVECAHLKDSEGWGTDDIAQLIFSRQYVDLRELRVQLLTRTRALTKLGPLSERIRDALVDKTPSHALSRDHNCL